MNHQKQGYINTVHMRENDIISCIMLSSHDIIDDDIED